MAMTLEQKLRSGHVRRWHIVAVSREQTIADHMHRVGVIAEEILTILGRFSWDSNLTINVMRWAFIHDRHEVVLGDIPTPGKGHLVQAGAWGAVHGAASDIDPEFKELADCVGDFYNEPPETDGSSTCPLAGDIVKLADLLEAMNYVGIFGCGSHAREVWYGLHAAAYKQMERVAVSAGIDKSPASGSAWCQLMSLKDALREGRHWA